tara:strand:- start:12293 stop:12589 length:297 start_codon:yes stop_codon:yes gene_type:complete
MKLAELSQKPELIKIEIDKAELVEKYGDTLEFYCFDRQPLDTFTKLANADSKDAGAMTMLMKDLILNEEGEPIINGESVLPMDVMIEAITMIGERLGK